jgi:DNA-binding CsgD family transcriptional regulator
MTDSITPALPIDHDVDFLERALDQKEAARLGEVVERAELILGRPTEAGLPRTGGIGPLIVALESWLTDRGVGEPAAERESHERQLERLRQRFLARREALARVEEAVGRLREITAPATILEVAPRQLCGATRLSRAFLSTVRDGAMVVTAMWFDGDPTGAEAALVALAGHPIRLEHPLVEAEMIRRRRATVVTDAHLHSRVDAHLTDAMSWTSYLAAPIVVRGRVIAVLHGDLRADQPDVLDREVLWRFAVGLAQAYERATLRRLLRQEREQMRSFLDRLNVRLGELSDSTVQFAPWNDWHATTEAGARRRSASGHSALGGLLTAREAEVLSLVSQGLSNRQIADQLVISQATVKFHMNSLLKKLRAGNRAEAVSRYLTVVARETLE